MGNYFKNGPSFAGLTWLVTVKKKKDFVPSLNNIVECDLVDEFPHWIV